MSCARWLGAAAIALGIGCRAAPLDFTEGTLENPESAWQPTPRPQDRSTDPPVSLLDVDASIPTMPGDEQREPPPPLQDTPPLRDADVNEADPSDTEDASVTASDAGATDEPEPQNDDDNGGLVGTVCDLLGGLLCPVGLLCVEGLCQPPSD